MGADGTFSARFWFELVFGHTSVLSLLFRIVGTMNFTPERQAELDEIRSSAKRRRVQQLREYFGSQNASCSSSNSCSSQSFPSSPTAATTAATATAAPVIYITASAEAEMTMDPLELDLLACSRRGTSVPFCFAYIGHKDTESSKSPGTQ